MSARLLYWIFTALLAVAALGTLVAVAFVIISPRIDQALITGFTVEKMGVGSALPMVSRIDSEAAMTAVQGQLTIVIPGFLAGLLRVIDVVLTGGLWIGLMWIMRRFFKALGSDRPFSRETTRELFWGGILLMGLPVWQLLSSLAWQVLLMDRIAPDTTITTMLGAAGSETQWRVLPEIDPGLALAGLVLLVMAKAFRLGMEIQQDNDEIV
ncbi:hypothetical protein [Spirochaeta lutea]|uniref:DUF2975 domain-containing protein n=1 Tax=Spirochaeta lutea TaxID=1480694 RepID=A0A098QT32_9SPIO|nr:hypothetical protein [Spirochaeta lutea]KGE70834.1 hypothetical protein DC28_15250 [Spirochaeta lutea]